MFLNINKYPNVIFPAVSIHLLKNFSTLLSVYQSSRILSFLRHQLIKIPLPLLIKYSIKLEVQEDGNLNNFNPTECRTVPCENPRRLIQLINFSIRAPALTLGQRTYINLHGGTHKYFIDALQCSFRCS